MSDESDLEVLGLKRWPFDVVPDIHGEVGWADRKALRAQIQRLVRKLRSHGGSTLHLLWADFGAGKTHTLLYIRQEAAAQGKHAMLPVYAALPRAGRSFVDVYRAIARALDVGTLRMAFEMATEHVGREEVERRLRDKWPDMVQCLRMLAMGGEVQQQTAMNWLLAEPGLTRKDLVGASLTGRIRTTDEAVLALSSLVELFRLSGFDRVILMMDEFQRIGVFRGGVQEEINAGLHTLFNECSSGLTIILSFSFGREANIRHFLNEELRDRADPVRFSIPALTPSEAVEFVEERLSAASIPGVESVLERGAIDFVIDRLAESGTLTPRRVIKGVGALVSEGRLDLEDGVIKSIDATYAADILATTGILSKLSDGEDDEE